MSKKVRVRIRVRSNVRGVMSISLGPGLVVWSVQSRVTFKGRVNISGDPKILGHKQGTVTG